MYQTIPPELLHPEMFIPAATLLGLLLGSFYNVCIHRYVSGESILFPPSHCPHCNQRLRFWELIPVLSYLLLRGQCARCHKPIHIRYPLVELLSGLTSGLLAWRFGPTLAFPVYLVFTGMLIVASGIDLECFILPDGITLGGTVLAVPAAIFALGMDWTDALLGGLVGGGTFLAVLLVFKRLRGVDGMGFGDVKLMLMLGVRAPRPAADHAGRGRLGPCRLSAHRLPDAPRSALARNAHPVRPVPEPRRLRAHPRRSGNPRLVDPVHHGVAYSASTFRT